MEQLLSFHLRLEAWLEANVTIGIRDGSPPATHNLIVAVERDLLIAEQQVCFPIVEDEQALLRNGGPALLKQSPAGDRGKLLALKLYRVGNPALWALHRLDISRKHRRLPDVQIRPTHLPVIGSLKPGDFEPLHGEPFQAGADTVIALLRKGLPCPEMQSRFYVAISEPDVIKTRPELATLMFLANGVSDAIELFEA